MTKPYITINSVDDKYLSIPNAAIFAGYKEQTIRNYIYGNKLQVYKFQNVSFLKKTDLLNLKNK